MNQETAQEHVQLLLDTIKTATRVLGITHREVAKRLGVSASYLSRVLSGKIELKAEHLFALIAAVGLSPEEFFSLLYPLRRGMRTESYEILANVFEVPAPRGPDPLPVRGTVPARPLEPVQRPRVLERSQPPARSQEKGREKTQEEREHEALLEMDSNLAQLEAVLTRFLDRLREEKDG